jgi:FixJ family two-component response regulator
MGSSGQFAVVIDDDESVARAISRLLRAAGIAVDTFTTARYSWTRSCHSRLIGLRA